VHFGTENGKIEAMKASTALLARQPVGLSLRAPHLAGLLGLAPALGCVEVRAIDIGAIDGLPAAAPRELASRWPLAVQASEIGACGEVGMVERPLEELERMAGVPLRRWSLPLAMHRDAGALAATVEVVQSCLGQPLLLELGQNADALSDTPRLADLARQTRSRLTLEPDRLLAQAVNRVRQAPTAPSSVRLMWQRAIALVLDTVWSLPPSLVGQIRTGGFREPLSGNTVSSEPQASRNQRMSPTGWAVLRQTLEHLGPVPTTLAWDADLPGLAVLLDEVRLAGELMAEVGADDEEALELDD
jgi:uncharacterized protein (UPF0276 family)